VAGEHLADGRNEAISQGAFAIALSTVRFAA
jgi:hypothetical protein